MKDSEAPSINVRHNAANHRFEAEVDGHLSVAEYQIRAGEIIFTHTFVPSELRGRGIAEKLIRAGLDHARREQLRVVADCSYVASFIRRHREYVQLTT